MKHNIFKGNYFNFLLVGLEEKKAVRKTEKIPLLHLNVLDQCCK
jgi:hypothetical protein